MAVGEKNRGGNRGGSENLKQTPKLKRKKKKVSKYWNGKRGGGVE